MAYKFNPLSGQIEDQSQGVQGPTGTVTAATDGGNDNPGIAFNDESNTGFYRIGGGTIGVTCTGTTSLRIDNSGRLSVVPNTNNYGVIQPLTSSDDKGLALYAGPNQTYTTGAAIRLTGAGNGGNVRIHGSNAAVTKGNIQLWTGANASLVIENTGNVGIGQSAPSSDYRVTIRSGTSPHSPLFLDTSESNYNTNLYFAKQGTAKWIIGNTATGDDFRFVSGSDERLRITSDGNLGIGTGTNSPDARVTVDGTTNPTVSIKTSGTKRVTLAADTGNSEGVLATYEGYPLKFSSSAGGGTNTVMTLLNNGKVGIGTDSPTYQLSTYGTGGTRHEIVSTDNNSAGLYMRTLNSGSMVSNVTLRTSNNGDFQIYTGTNSDAERLKINSTGDATFAGKLLVDGASAYDAFGSSSMYVDGYVCMGKTDTAIAGNEQIGGLRFYSNDTNINSDNFLKVGGLDLEADGDFLVGDAPTRMVFKTMKDGTTTLTEALRLDSSQNTIFAGNLEATGASDVRLTLGSQGVAGSENSVYVAANGGDLKFNAALSGDTHFSSGTTSTVSILSSGDVGIGETSPTARLELKDSAATVLKLNSTSSDGTALRIYNNASEKMLIGSAGEFIVGQGNNVDDSAIRANGDFLISTGGGGYERMRINSTGGVVIRHNGATESEGYAGLEVRAAKDKHQLVLASSSNPANDNRATLGFKVSQTGQNERVKGAIIVEGTGDVYGQADYMSFCLDSSADNSNADTTADEKLRITSDGNVGIGTAIPTHKLEVNGTSRFNNYIEFGGTISTPSTAAAIYRPADNSLAFSTGNVERLLIDNYGAATFEGNINLATNKELKFGDGNFKLWRSSNGNNYINSPGSNSLIIQAQGNTAVEVKNNKDVEFTGQVRVGSTGGHNLNASTGLELRGPSISSNSVSTDHFKALKLAYNDGNEWGGQALFSLGRWEEPSDANYQNDARSSLKISLGHGAQNSGSDPDADVLLLKSDKSATFYGDIKMADGKGIDFTSYDGNDTSGTATGNVLKDYEEGTWVPVLKTGSNTITIGSSNVWEALYTKIGNKVTVSLTLMNSEASGTIPNSNAFLTIEGLPFTSVANARSVGTAVICQGILLTEDPSYSHLETSSSILGFRHKDSASSDIKTTSVATLTAAGGNGAYFNINHTYFTT